MLFDTAEGALSVDDRLTNSLRWHEPLVRAACDQDPIRSMRETRLWDCRATEEARQNSTIEVAIAALAFYATPTATSRAARRYESVDKRHRCVIRLTPGKCDFFRGAPGVPPGRRAGWIRAVKQQASRRLGP